MQNNVTLPFLGGNLVLKPVENGYQAILITNEGQNEVFRLTEHTMKISAYETAKYGTIDVSLDRIGRLHQSQNLVQPAADQIVQAKDGRLYCLECHRWVPNTANHEMRKEGCFATSHICGIDGWGETEDRTSEAAKQLFWDRVPETMLARVSRDTPVIEVNLVRKYWVPVGEGRDPQIKAIYAAPPQDDQSEQPPLVFYTNPCADRYDLHRASPRNLRWDGIHMTWYVSFPDGVSPMNAVRTDIDFPPKEGET